MNTLQYWINLVNRYIGCETQEETEQVAQYAMDNDCGVYHALYEVNGRQGSCGCSPCNPKQTKSPFRYHQVS